MHFACRSFIGKPTPNVWSQYWENEPDDISVVREKGHLFGIISFTSVSENENISSLGHQFIDDISQNYFSSEDKDVLLSLDNTLNEFVSQNTLKADFATILLAVTHKGRIYLALYNQGQAIISRQGKVSRILSGRDETTVKLSGPVQTGDKLVLLTQSFFETVNWTTIKEILSEPTLQSIEESFLSCLYSLPESQGMAGALIQVHLEDSDLVLDTDIDPNLPDIASEPQLAPVVTQQPIVQQSLSSQFVPPRPKRNLFANLFKPRGVFVDHYHNRQLQRRKHVNLIIAVLLLSALGCSAYYGFRKNQSVQTEAKYQSLKQDLDKKLNDAAAIKNLNLEAALQLARQADSLHGQMVPLNLHPDELSDYKNKIKNILSKTGSPDDFTPETYYDTSLIEDNPNYSQLEISGNNLILLDSSKGRIDSVNIGQRSTKNLIKSDSVKDVTRLVPSGDYLYAITPKSILLINKGKADQKADLSQAEPPLEIISSQSWNGALYLLDGRNSTIWKLNPNASGFGSPQNWIQSGKLDRTPASLAINGRIWVLSQDGGIIPYNRGVAENFKMPLETKLTSARNLVTTLETEILAFTEADNIVYVIKKNGEAVGKYNLGSKKIHDLVIDEKNNQIFVLVSDQKIYRILLQQ